jgi:hypothetical protein
MLGHKLVMGTPESKAKWHNVAKDTMYNYAPSLDKDIVDTQSHLGGAEASRQHKWVIEDVQAAQDMRLESDPVCGSGGCNQYKHKKTALGYPIDYPVPSYGVDPDVEANANSISIAEAMHQHKLVMGTPESKAKWHNVAKDTMYDFAPTLDEDMKSTAGHIGISEGMNKHKWVIEDVQAAEDMRLGSDPICSSAGCTQFKHKATPLGYPIDYPVPSFGADPDVEANANSVSIAEAMHQHKLIMGTPESKAKWHNVAKDTLYNYAPELDEDMKNTAGHLGLSEGMNKHKWVIEDLQTEADVASDPICSSAGCTQYKHKSTPLGYPIDYPVPSFGSDPEIDANAKSVSIAEAMHQHKLIMGTAESKAKWHNVAKDTMYNFAPELDDDMKNTAGHLGIAEGMTKHKWVIED